MGQHERRNVPTELTEINRLIREDYGQLHANKLDSLKEMDRFLERQKDITNSTRNV